MSGGGEDKTAILWKIAGAALGVFFTVSVTRFVDNQDKQQETTNKILLEINGINVQMEAASFKDFRREIDTLKHQVTTINENIKELEGRIEP